jgi:putative transcriptional regulator
MTNEMPGEQDLKALRELLGDHAPASGAPDSRLRSLLLDLADAPSLPIDRASFDWTEVTPGIKLTVVHEDAARGTRACLAWGRAGAKTPRHIHRGGENILVLEGRLRDERGSYGPGEVCYSAADSIHAEEVVEDCLCYVVYYGELETVEDTAG